MMLDGRQAGMVGFQQFFQCLLSYCHAYAEHAQEGGAAAAGGVGHNHQLVPPEMPAADVEGLEAYLGVMAKLVSEGDRDRTHQRLHLLREEYGAEYHVTAMFPLEPLMRLYCCKICPSLRGKILDTVGAFALTPHEAATIWARLEATAVLSDAPLGHPAAPALAAPNGYGAPGMAFFGSRMLAPQPAAPPAVADLRYQLNQVEDPVGMYPETLAFVRLLNRLVSVSVSRQDGAAFGPAADEGRGLTRYYRFLRHDVFSTLPHRRFLRPAQKWELAK
eukprot:5869558-Pyramimonas_sp.AAC.1